MEQLGYVVRRTDPTDRRAKLVTLTDKGHACIPAGIATIDGIEQQLTKRLAERGGLGTAATNRSTTRYRMRSTVSTLPTTSRGGEAYNQLCEPATRGD